MTDLLIAGHTDVGQRRQDNQDTFICQPLWTDTTALLVVIDGVGGYAGGDRAAAIAKGAIERYMATPTGDPLSMLREAVVFANNQINTERQTDARLAQMCCVLTAVLADTATDTLYYVHVGDTRLYRFRQQSLDKLTADHSIVGMREDARELSEADAMRHPRRNEILRDVGSMPHRVDDPDFLDWGETDFQVGDQLLLCSDGLTDMLTQQQIRSVLAQSISIDQQISELIRLANAAGGNDNITVLMAKRPDRQPLAEPVIGQRREKSARKVSARTETMPATPLPPPVAADPPKPTAGRHTGLWIGAVLLLLGGLAALFWYQSNPAPIDQVQAVSPDSTGSALPVAGADPLDSLRQLAFGTPDRQLRLPADTLRIWKPLTLNDSLRSVLGDSTLTVLIPGNASAAALALRVGNLSTASLTNLVIRGFSTGIETTRPGQLQLRRVYFSQVDQPVRASVGADTALNTLITVSVQPQPPTSRPQ